MKSSYQEIIDINIILGLFTTDPLEKEFGKLRMGCGGTYFINVQQVVEKTSIKHGKLLLQLGIELDNSAGHKCDSCSRKMTIRECTIFEDLSDPIKLIGIEDKLDSACKNSLCTKT